MPLGTFPVPKKDPRFSFPNKFGVTDEIFTAIVRQVQLSSGGLVVVDDEDYTIGDLDTHILYKNLSMARTLTIPAASSNQNRVLVIGHGGSGIFLVNLSVTVRENQSTSINSLGTSAERYMIMSDGTDWWIVR